MCARTRYQIAKTMVIHCVLIYSIITGCRCTAENIVRDVVSMKFTIKQTEMKVFEFTNSVDPDEAAPYESRSDYSRRQCR